MAGSEVMHKEGAPVASWPVTACLSRGQVRAYIPAQNDKSAVCGGRTASPYSRFGLVGKVPRRVEWHFDIE